MITLSDLQKFDPSGMYKVYDMWPQIAREAHETELKEVSYSDINHIVFAGMGG